MGETGLNDIQLKMDRKVVSRMIADDGTMATALLIISMSAYGPEVYEVDPMEIVTRLEEDFGAKVTDDNENKLKAILLASSTHCFFTDPEAFTGIANTLIGGDPGLNELDELTIPEVCWALFEVPMVHGPMELLPRVQRLVESIMSQEVTDPEGEPIDQEASHYVDSIMKEMHSRLLNQLTEIGVPPSDIPSLDSLDVPTVPDGDAQEADITA